MDIPIELLGCCAVLLIAFVTLALLGAGKSP